MAIFNTVYGGEPNWKPSSNTVAYFPFKEDQLDHSWNWVVISWSGTKSTIWYNFTSAATISISDCNWFCSWVKLNSASWAWSFGTFYDKKSMWWYVYDTSNNHFWPCIWTFYTSNYDIAKVTIPSPTQWNFFWVWYDGTNTVYCLNDTYWVLHSWSWYNFWSLFAIATWHSWVSYNVNYSDFIVESSAWTSGIAIKYYNNTKSTYWY